MTTQEFMKEHLDLELKGGRNILNVTAAFQHLSGESDAELLMLALTWMTQVNMGPGWIEMLQQCQKQQTDSNEVYEAEKKERQRAAVAALGPTYGMSSEHAFQKLLNKYVEECAEMSHKRLASEINYQGSQRGQPAHLRIALAELAKRQQTDTL